MKTGNSPGLRISCHSLAIANLDGLAITWELFWTALSLSHTMSYIAHGALLFCTEYLCCFIRTVCLLCWEICLENSSASQLDLTPNHSVFFPGIAN